MKMRAEVGITGGIGASGLQSTGLLLALFTAYVASGFAREVIYLLVPITIGISILQWLGNARQTGSVSLRPSGFGSETSFSGPAAWSMPSIRFVAFYSALTLGSLLFSAVNGALGRGLVETLFVVGALLTALSLAAAGWREVGVHDWLEKLTRFLAVFSLGMLLYEGGRAVLQGMVGQVGSVLELLVLSKSATEHSVTPNLGFLFGAVAVFMAVRRRWLWMIAPMVLVMLSSKRIVWLGLVGSIGWWVVAVALASRYDWVRRSQHAIVPAAACLALLALMRFANGGFDQILMMRTGLDPNLLSMGRRALFDLMLSLESGGWLPLGIGTTHKVLAPYESITGLTNLHSDILKIYLEYGLIFSVAVAGAFHALCRRSPAITALVLYYLVLFLTDNVTVYFEVGVFFFLMVFSLSAAESAMHSRSGTTRVRIAGLSGIHSTLRRYRLVPV